jgi:glyceraldehyde 3-phosphate dehydrogenase
MAVRVGINGFGRIGRLVLRAALKTGRKNLEFVAVNDITDAKTLAHLFKYDSVHGKFDGEVSATDNAIVVNGKTIRITAEKEPGKIPWKELGVDIVVEGSGKFNDKEKAAPHFAAGAKKVVCTAPTKGEDITIVMGVNHDQYDPAKHHLISNASCTTNCLAPVVKVIHQNFAFQRAFMTTVHAYTNDQKILDLPHKDLRRARAAAMSIIPTTTGAAKATALVIPEVKGKIDGVALRVPTCDVSSVNLVVHLEKPTTAAEVNAAFAKAAGTAPMKGFLTVTDEPLVSVDFIGNPYSSIVDLLSTSVVDGTLLGVMAWYDNEYGYSMRVVDLVDLVAAKL